MKVDFFDWLFFGSNFLGDFDSLDSSTKKTSPAKIKNLDEYFLKCLLLVNKQSQLSRFKKNMWKRGKTRLPIGIKVVLDDGIHLVSSVHANYFMDDENNKFKYEQIIDIKTFPKLPKFSMRNIKKGMKLRLYNKRFTGNVYTVTKTYKNGFDAKNGKYVFFMLGYDTIDLVL